MDWLRVGAFVLLILYHVGFDFTPWGYSTPTRGPVPYAELPLLALNAWRLGLLFAISGYASAALMAKQGSTGAFLRSRLVRLGVPLLFGLTVVVPPQPWIALASDQGYDHGLLYFVVHDFFSFRRIGTETLPTTMHLWFVVYLIAYTAALCLAAAALPPTWRAAIQRGAERVLAGPMLVPLGVLYVFSVRLLPGDWTDTHSFATDFVAHLHYGALFLFGFLLRHSESLRAAIARQWKLAALVALAGYAWVAGDDIAFPGNVPTPPDLMTPFLVAKAAQGWATIIALFGIADRYWNRDHRWRPTLVEAVFPFYIIHQTVTVLTSHLIENWGLTALPEFLILCLATAAGCWAFYLVGREIGPLRPLIGLARKRRPAPAAPVFEPEPEAAPATGA